MCRWPQTLAVLIAMRRNYGTFLSRLLWRGISLTESEFAVLQVLVSALPDGIRRTVEMQFDVYNLVQREIDGREINFYRKSRHPWPTTIPMLQSRAAEAPLVKLTAEIEGDSAPVHAVLSAVNGRVFCMTLDRRLTNDRAGSLKRVYNIVQSWRSNFVDSSTTPSKSDKTDLSNRRFAPPAQAGYAQR